MLHNFLGGTYMHLVVCVVERLLNLVERFS